MMVDFQGALDVWFWGNVDLLRWVCVVLIVAVVLVGVAWFKVCVRGCLVGVFWCLWVVVVWCLCFWVWAVCWMLGLGLFV